MLWCSITFMPFAWETVPSLQTARPSRSRRNYLNIHFVVFKVFHSSFCPGADELWHYEYGEYSQHPQVSTCGGDTGTALWSPPLSLRNVGFFFFSSAFSSSLPFFPSYLHKLCSFSYRSSCNLNLWFLHWYIEFVCEIFGPRSRLLQG